MDLVEKSGKFSKKFEAFTGGFLFTLGKSISLMTDQLLHFSLYGIKVIDSFGPSVCKNLH